MENGLLSIISILIFNIYLNFNIQYLLANIGTKLVIITLYYISVRF